MIFHQANIACQQSPVVRGAGRGRCNTSALGACGSQVCEHAVVPIDRKRESHIVAAPVWDRASCLLSDSLPKPFHFCTTARRTSFCAQSINRCTATRSGPSRCTAPRC